MQRSAVRGSGIVLAAAAAAAAVLAACQGQVGDVGSGNGGPGSGAGGSRGPGATGSGGSSGSGGLGGSNGGGGAGVASPIDLSGSPQYYRFVRLTNAQWARSVQDVLNLAAPTGLDANFQSAVAGGTAFTNNELVLKVTQRAWTDYQSAAEELAKQVTASTAALARVYAGTDAAGFIATLGRRAYRRPLTAAETAAYTALFNRGATLSGTATAFAKGAGLVIRAMLQSPHFLFRTEMSPNGAPLTGYEMAAKLSLWLRGSTPSDALLDAAAGPGRLDTADGAAAMAATMLGEAAATAVMRQFHGELLHFDRYETISKLGVPSYKESLNAEYEQSSYLYFDKIFTQGLGVRELLTSTSGFVGPGMAALYGVAAPPAGGSGFVERDLGAQRVGYFSQLPFLTLHGLNGEADSIHRGVSLNLDVLCAALGPPAAVIPPVPALQPGQTNRQRISTLTSGCGGSCHNEQINPLGFAFEHFDGMGQFQSVENGNLTIDSSGSYAFTEGEKSFTGAADLMRLMADGRQAHTCYAKKLAGFALQRDIVAADRPMLETLTDASLAAGGSVKQVALTLVRHDAFRTRVGGAQ